MTGLRASGHDTLGCARQVQALSSVIMLDRGKVRRWPARQASCSLSRRTVRGAAEFRGRGPHNPGLTLKRAKALAFLRGLKAWVPAPEGTLIMEREGRDLGTITAHPPVEEERTT
jgi:hypothetical protein